jgi:hypothetical protein
VRRKSRQHGAEEFGKRGLGSAAAIGDRGIGTAAGVVVDGIVERESGRTPDPAAVSTKAVAVVLGAMLLVSLSVVGVLVILGAPEPLPAGSHHGLWASLPSSRPVTSDTRFEFMSEPDEDNEVTVWFARPDERTVYLIDGREVGAAEFGAYLKRGAWPADVTASAAGVITRVEVLTPGVTSDP